jgi:hypothetical protein
MTAPIPAQRSPSRPLLIVVIITAIFFAWITWRLITGDREPTSAALECKDRYAGARSFSDTARVDGTYPKDYAQGSRRPTTCGDLRRDRLLPE